MHSAWLDLSPASSSLSSIESSAGAAQDGEPVPLCARAAIRLLDVGGGHGELTIEVLEEWPRSTVVLQDFSAPMLDTARKRLAGYADRVEFARSDLAVAGWSKSLRSSFDAVVSAIAIHNVGDAKTIRAIYAEITELVVPGGRFFNLDSCSMGGPAISELYARLLGRPSARASSIPVVEPASLSNQLRWLKEIGFDEVDCIWKEERRTLLCGLRHR